MKLVRQIKICLNETCSKFHIDKNLSDVFPIWNSLKQGGALLPLPFSFVLESAIRSSKKMKDCN
jgi:hypothetical protein